MTHFMYVLKAGPDQYKVGHSKTPQNRVKQLQTGNPFALSIHRLYQFDRKVDAIEAEGIVKDRLGMRHFTAGGEEWFLVPIGVLNSILFDIFMRTNVLNEWNATTITDRFIAP